MIQVFLILVTVLAVLYLVQAFCFSILEHLLEEPVRADEVHWVETEDHWRIRLCRYRPIGGDGAPVLLCHGAFANQFNFAAPQGHSVVDGLVERGYDCWVIDFRGDRSARPPSGQRRFDAAMDDYILRDAPAAIDYIRDATGYAQVHWIGHSLGGMILYAYVLARGAAKLATGVTLGAPPGFRGVRLHSSDRLLALLKRVPRLCEFAIRCAAPLGPVTRISTPYTPINWRNMHPKAGPATFFSMIEVLPYRVARELSSWASTNAWWVEDGQIDVISRFGSLDLPLFVIYASRDPLIPEQNRQAFYDVLPSEDKRMLVLSEANGHSADYNHVDLTFARNGREEVCQPMADWLDAHPIARQSPKKESAEAAAPAPERAVKKTLSPRRKAVATKRLGATRTHSTPKTRGVRNGPAAEAKPKKSASTARKPKVSSKSQKTPKTKRRK